MSRYSLKPLPECSDIFEVAVGWDPGLNTFFVAVFGYADAGCDPDVRFWQGGKPDQIMTVAELQILAAPYAEIPPEIARRLGNDQCHKRASYPQRWSRLIAELLGNRGR